MLVAWGVDVYTTTMLRCNLNTDALAIALGEVIPAARHAAPSPRVNSISGNATMMNRLILIVSGITTIAAMAMAAEPVREFAPLPKAVSSFGAVAIDDAIYVYGGHSGKAHTYSTKDVLGTFHRLNAKADAQWQEMPGSTHLQGLALVAHQGKIIRIGGMQPHNAEGEPSDNRSVATVERFDPKTNQWEKLPDMPVARSSHDAVVLGDQLFVFGGWQMNGKGNEPVWHDFGLVADLTQKKIEWKKIEQPFQRRALTAAAFAGKVYIIAGMTSDGELERGTNIYDPAQKTWAKGAILPEPRLNGFTPASCVVGDRLYVNAADGKVYRLTAKGDTYEEVGEVKDARYVHRMVSISQGRMVVLGGASKKGNVARTEVLGSPMQNAPVDQP